ncbi:MAG: hypothetical protein AAGG44_11160 [Planctomycetota bacterium]
MLKFEMQAVRRGWGSIALALVCFGYFAAFGVSEKAAAQTGFSAGSSIPYFVEPSRFQYNRPQSRGEIRQQIPNTTFNIQVPQRNFLYVPRPYYYGGFYNRPRFYYRPIGPNTYLGPFVPIRRF